MCSNNNTYELNHLSDNWGFYVDIENLNPPLEKKYKINYCETIHEEHEYYCKDNYIEVNDESKISNMIVNVSSTIFITAILTYFIFFII